MLVPNLAHLDYPLMCHNTFQLDHSTQQVFIDVQQCPKLRIPQFPSPVSTEGPSPIGWTGGFKQLLQSFE